MIDADLRSYYEEEARLGLRDRVSDYRRDLRDAYAALLTGEERRRVVDFGAGPGEDVRAFAAHGLEAVGVELAHANCVRARSVAARLVQASLTALPLRPRSFDAGWSMAVLMHLPEAQVSTALGEMTTALRPGAPLRIGLWGGTLGLVIGDEKIPGQRRPFHLRPLERNHTLLSQAGTVEDTECRSDFGGDGWEWQLFRIRVGR